MQDFESSPAVFDSLGLAAPILRALSEQGYASPTPIQARTIPLVLKGHDVLGQAQTGTGKTAAFALPLLSRLRCGGREPRVLVLAPTRELALQVAESVETYGRYMEGLRVAAIYGGAAFKPQLQALKRGVDVVVGTPGRVMDHMRRGTLQLGGLDCLVLDEADEMLRMGFIDDVSWILDQTPDSRQIALFSATMPAPIRRIAEQYLREPSLVTIQAATTTAPTIRQRHWFVRARDKPEVLARILGCEKTEGVLVFVRTKTASVALAEALTQAGHCCSVLNGDVPQKMRERTVEQLRDGAIDVIIATDVAARGLDVDRISHVINYDMPQDPQTYVHRIGRTGRAGRRGEAILLLTRGQERQLRAIERETRQPIERFAFPSRAEVNERRIEELKDTLRSVLDAEDIGPFESVVSALVEETGASAVRLAAALAKQLRGSQPLLLPEPDKAPATVTRPAPRDRALRSDRASRAPASPRTTRRSSPAERGPKSSELRRRLQPGMVRYRIEVGRVHGAQAKNIVGCIANEAGLAGRFIGPIDLRDEFALVDLPEGMPREILRALKRAWVSGKQLRMTKA